MCPAGHSNTATSQLHTTQRLVKISYDAMAPCQSPIAAANVGLLNPRRQLPHGNGGDCARRKTPHTTPPREQLDSPLDIKLAFDIVRRVQFLTGRRRPMRSFSPGAVAITIALCKSAPTTTGSIRCVICLFSGLRRRIDDGGYGTNSPVDQIHEVF